jgi:hypothetical protein
MATKHLRHSDTSSASELAPLTHARLLVALALLLGAGAASITLLAGGAFRPPAEHTPFVAQALGKPMPHSVAVRRPAPGVTVGIDKTTFKVSAGRSAVGLEAAASSAAWRTYAHGVRRPTTYGHETIVVDPSRTEQYLTVDRHLGAHTWHWQLQTLDLTPRLGDDGSVGFLRNGHTLDGISIAPARIYDAAGHDRTPAGTRWALSGHTLSLTVDDTGLPLPYVVDPAITYDTLGAVGSAATTSVALAVPAGVRVNDVLIAHFATRGIPTVSTTPPGWTASPAATANTNVKDFVYWHKVAAADPATVTWVLNSAQEWAGAITAFSGLKASGPASVKGAAATGTTVNSITAPGIGAGVVASSLELVTYALASGAAGLNWSTPAGAPTMTQAFQAQSPNATAANRVSLATDFAFHGAGATTVARTASCTNCAAARMIGIQSTWLLDPTLPTAVTLAAPLATARGTVTLTGSATEPDSSLDLVFQRSPAGAASWTTIGTATTSPYQASFDTTLLPDGFYDLRVVARNGAWASTADDVASAVATVRVDNSAPDQDVLSVAELTGGQFQYFDAATSTQYYNPVGGSGTFRLTAAPRDVQDSIQLRGTSSGGNGTGGPLTLAKPAGTTTGDVMILHAGYEAGTGATLVPPAGWTLLTRQDVGASWGQAAYYKVATAGEPASYTFSLAAPAANISGGISAWSGVSTTNPIDAFAGSTATSLTITAPSVTTKGGCDRLLALNGIWTTAPAITPAATMTERYDVASAEPQSDTGSESADQILGAAGATGTRVATAVSGGVNTVGDRANSGITIALRPAVCVKSVVFPAPGQTGFTGGGNTATVAPFVATTYSFNNTNTTEPGAKSVTTNDEAGNTPLQTTFTMTRDVTAPSSVGAPTAGGFYNVLSVPVAIATTATDSGAGVDATSYTVQRDSGNVANGVCTWANTWVTVTLTGGNDTTVTAPKCFRYRMRVLDNVGNAGTSAASGTVIVDRTAPSAAGTISIAESNPSTYASGTTIFYAPSGAGGTFDVTDTNPADANAGIGKVRFPALTGGFTPAVATDDSSVPYTQTYTWSTGATDSGSKPITVFDAAGNSVATSFTLAQDATAPTATVTAPASGAKFRAATYSTAWSGTSTDGAGSSGVAGIAVSLQDPAGNYWNGSAFSGAVETFNTATGTTAWSWTAPALTTNGTYTVHVRATDNVGNLSITTRTFVYDTTAPTFGALSLTKLGNCDASVYLSGSAVFYSPSAAACASAFTMTQPLSDLGGSGASTVKFPAIASGSFAHSLNTVSSPFTSTSYGWTAINAAYGAPAQTQTLTVTDGAGNTATTTFTIQKDSAGAATAFTAPAAAAVVRNGQTISATASEGAGNAGVKQVELRYCAGATCTYGPSTAIGGPIAAPGPYTTVWNSQPADGAYTILLRSTDNVGNVTDVTRSVTIDNTAPITGDDAPAGAQNHDVTINLSATDNLSGVAFTEYSLDSGTSWTTGSTVTILASSGDGVKTVTYRSHDVAGNIEGPRSTQVTIDTTAPSGGVTDPGSVLRGTVDLTASPPDPDVASVQFLFRPAGPGAWTAIGTDTSAPYSIPWITTGPATPDGLYDLEEAVTDNAGNVTTVALSPKTIDNTAPAGAAVTAPAQDANIGAPTIALAANAADATSGVASVAFEVKPVGAASFTTVDADTNGAPFTGAWAAVGIPDGPVDIRIAVTDVAGNGPTYSPTITFTLDRTSPAVALSAPSDVAASASLTATGSADIDHVDYAYAPHGSGSWSPIGTGSTPSFAAAWTTPLADGLYDVRATAVDTGGNQGNDMKVVRVDRTPPTGVLTQPAAAATIGGTTVALAANASDTGSSVASVTFQFRPSGSGAFANIAVAASVPYAGTWDASALVSGSYDIRALIADNAGNTTTDTRTVTVASTSPLGSSPADPPRGFAGVVAFDGLTLRWGPGIATVSRFVLYADGLEIGIFGGSQFETKLGEIGADDSRRFTLTEISSTGVESAPTPALRVLPPLAGASQTDAAQALTARGFTVGTLTAVAAPGQPAGTVVGPTGVQLQLEGSAVDLQIASGTIARGAYALSPASAPRVSSRSTTLVMRVLVTDRSRIDVTLDAAPYKRLQRWHFFHINAGSAILRLHLAHRLGAGPHRLYWKATGEGDHTVRRTTTPLRVIADGTRAHAANPVQVLSVLGQRALDAAALRGMTVRPMAPEQAILFATYHDVSVIVVDADLTGVAFVQTVRRVFPTTAVVALSASGSRRAQLAQSGAHAVPAGTSSAALVALVRRLATS